MNTAKYKLTKPDAKGDKFQSSRDGSTVKIFRSTTEAIQFSTVSAAKAFFGTI